MANRQESKCRKKPESGIIQNSIPRHTDSHLPSNNLQSFRVAPVPAGQPLDRGRRSEDVHESGLAIFHNFRCKIRRKLFSFAHMVVSFTCKVRNTLNFFLFKKNI